MKYHLMRGIGAVVCALGLASLFNVAQACPSMCSQKTCHCHHHGYHHARGHHHPMLMGQYYRVYGYRVANLDHRVQFCHYDGASNQTYCTMR